MVPSKPKNSGPRSAPSRIGQRRRSVPAVEADTAETGRRLSWRTGVFLLIIALVLVMFLPSINSALKQAQQISALKDEINATQTEVEQLEDRNEKLKDPAYIARQAREDQYFVKKGENAVIVINHDESEDESAADGQPVRAQAWYLELLESIQQVGQAAEKG